MPYESKPGTRKYGNNPMKPAAPKFNLRSGNGPLQFKQMGASPAKTNGLLNTIGSAMGSFNIKTGDEINKDKKLQASIESSVPEVKTYNIDESKTEKVKPVDLKIKRTDKKSSTSSRPGGTDPVTKTPEEQGMHKAKKDVPEKKKGWLKKAGSWIKEKAEKAKEFRESEAGAQWDKTWKGIAGALDPKGKERGLYPTDQLEKFHEGKRTQELHDVKMANVEREQLKMDTNTERQQQLIQAHKDATEGTYELPVTKDFISTAEKVMQEKAQKESHPESEYQMAGVYDPEKSKEEDSPTTFNRKNRLKFGK